MRGVVMYTVEALSTKDDVREFVISRRVNIVGAAIGAAGPGQPELPGLRLQRPARPHCSQTSAQGAVRPALLRRLAAGRQPDRGDAALASRSRSAQRRPDRADPGELSTRSPQFRTNWAEQDVHEHHTGRKTYRHPEAITPRSTVQMEKGSDPAETTRSGHDPGYAVRDSNPEPADQEAKPPMPVRCLVVPTGALFVDL